MISMCVFIGLKNKNRLSRKISAIHSECREPIGKPKKRMLRSIEMTAIDWIIHIPKDINNLWWSITF